MRKRIGLLLFFFLSAMLVFGEGSLVLLVPTGEKHDGMEVFRKLKPSDPIFFRARNKFTRGLIAESIYLHGILQNYLIKKGKIQEKYPLYLALTEHQGGGARKGLIIEDNGTKKKLKDAWYIDIHHKAIEQNPAELGSYHQIIPHEIGYVFLRLLLGECDIFTPKVHYFCTQTDPRVAFFEGFAESFQYVAIVTEQDQRIKRSIQENVKQLGLSFTRELHAFRREFSWPGRLGFYRASMPKWYQDLENYRRYNFIESKLIQRPARSIENSDPWVQRFYLDASVWPDIRRHRTKENAVATEGVIAAFFSFMLQSNLKRNYYHPQYYREFLPNDSSFIFEREIYPLRNQYLKIFTVFDKYVNLSNSLMPPVIQFIEGYLREYPTEEQIVKAIWKEASGLDYSAESAMELWVVNLKAKFIPWVMSSFGPKQEEYSFDLNAADSVDLICINGFKTADVPLWLEARKQKGGFSSLQEASSIPGLSNETVNALNSLKLISKQVKNKEETLSTTSLIIYPLLHFVKMGFLWYLLLALVYYLVARITHYPLKPLNFLWNFLAFNLYILTAAVITFVVDKNILVMSILSLGIISIHVYNGYYKKIYNWPAIIFTCFMALVLAYSLY